MIVCFEREFRGLTRVPDVQGNGFGVAAETSSTAGLAGRYATAFYELADEAKTLDAVAADLAQLKNLIAESADLLYHLMVVLKIADVPLQDVLNELQRRTNQSGLQEKANRQTP